ncbi:DUF2782 domain-containing protein [Ideonella azotifigens]|uniref:DUF2782 domain-containing protein n=1 Tax=Ideonella azotifigens TaxID=513160 RepID=A0ABP3VPZ1_9BURK|nr:DUF2782 domain-containing protein [Ideonella azotifigens]MCD2343036.1 DUF2782 domain-containing protein [Ideonella azotifigens]
MNASFRPRLQLCALCLGLLAAGSCLAQAAAPAAAPAPLTGAAALKPLPPVEAAAPTSKVPEPQILHGVTEDDEVRIEELRVRGQTQRITVQPKHGSFPAYDIVPRDNSRPPSQDPKAGQRVWLSLPFDF